jgi:DNA-binding response OmpR family regulator
MARELPKSQSPVRFGGGFELDPRAYELRRSGRALKLEPTPMEILLLLIERRGQLVTRGARESLSTPTTVSTGPSARFGRH